MKDAFPNMFHPILQTHSLVRHRAYTLSREITIPATMQLLMDESVFNCINRRIHRRTTATRKRANEAILHESFTVGAADWCCKRANEAILHESFTVGRDTRPRNRANEAILHGFFTLSRWLSRDSVRNRQNEANLVPSCRQAWMLAQSADNPSLGMLSTNDQGFILACRMIPLQPAGEGFGGVFEVDDAAMARSGAGGRGVQEQRAHDDDAPGGDEAVDGHGCGREPTRSRSRRDRACRRRGSRAGRASVRSSGPQSSRCRRIVTIRARRSAGAWAWGMPPLRVQGPKPGTSRRSRTAMVRSWCQGRFQFTVGVLSKKSPRTANAPGPRTASAIAEQLARPGQPADFRDPPEQVPAAVDLAATVEPAVVRARGVLPRRLDQGGDPIRGRDVFEDRVSVASQAFDPAPGRRARRSVGISDTPSPSAPIRCNGPRHAAGFSEKRSPRARPVAARVASRLRLPGAARPRRTGPGRCLRPTPLVTWKDHAEEGTGMGYGIVMVVATIVAQAPGGRVRFEKAKAQDRRAQAKAEAPASARS